MIPFYGFGRLFMSRFNLRGFASLLLSLSFVVVLATGLVLWLAHSPQTFGIGKEVWKHTHIWTSLLMAVAAVLHFVLNWSVYWSYLWRKAAARLNLKWELALALAVTVAIVATAALHPDDMAQRFAVMNLPQIAQMSGQTVDELVAILKKEGIAVHEPKDSLREIAEHNKVPPQAVSSVLMRQMRGGPRHGR
jgi:hypothetical protein